MAIIKRGLMRLLLVSLPCCVQAQFTFVTNNGAITITGYNGSGGNIIVPSVINGYSVKGIDHYAFSPPPGNPNPITSVVIPDSVTNIGASAFLDCSGLTNAVISTNVTELSIEVFGFSGLTSFIFPSGITSIDGGAFDNCLSLTNVVIPNGVQYIGDYAFNDNYSMTSVTIPDSVTNLGDWSFEGCLNITNLIIGNGITSIAPATFAWCPKLTTVSIPDSVTNIGTTYYYSAFSGCPALTNITYGSGLGINVGNLRFSGSPNLAFITVSSNNPVLSSRDGVLFDKSQATLLQCPIGKTGIYTIPNTVTSIWKNAFLNCIQLTDIGVSGDINNIGGTVFTGCSGVTNIIIYEGVSSILSGLFYGCTNLQSFEVGSGNLFYCDFDGVLYDKSRNTLVEYPYRGAGSMTIPTGVKSITTGAFSFCTTLTNITLPDTLANIGTFAFAECYGLTSVTIPNGISDIADSTFNDCINLAIARIPASVTNIGADAFWGCQELSIVIFSGNVPSVDTSAFTYIPLDPFGSGIIPATIYYLPRTIGWNTTLAGVPTVLWNPQPQTTDGSFGVQNNQFGFNITGTTNILIVVEACSNLANAVWSPLLSCLVTNGSIYFSDSQYPNFTSRIYRIRSP